MLLIRSIFTIEKVVYRTNALILADCRACSLATPTSTLLKSSFRRLPRRKRFVGIFALPDIVVVNVKLGQPGLHNRIQQYCNDMDVIQHELFLKNRQKDPLQGNSWSGILLHFDNPGIIYNLHVNRLQVLDERVAPEGDLV